VPILLRRLLTVALIAACLTVVVAYQVTRPVDVAADPRVFVPSPGFYQRLPESWQTTVADAYWLAVIQYYGEHVNGDKRFDSLPAMVDLVTTLNPQFAKAYFFGAFAAIDAGQTPWGYELLKRGYAENPDDWRFPFYLGFYIYNFARNSDKDVLAAQMYEQAAKLPGAPDFVSRLAAILYGKGDEKAKAVRMWFAVYAEGDEVARQRAVDELKKMLPTTAERRDALDRYGSMLSQDRYTTLQEGLMGGQK